MIREIKTSAKKKVVIRDALGRTIVIDATISEDHLFTSQATMHEIESGDNISDHVIKKPIQLTLSGIISGDPYGDWTTWEIDDDPPGPTGWKNGELIKIGSGAFTGAIGSAFGGGIAGGAAILGASKVSGTILQNIADAENEKTRQGLASQSGDNGYSPIVDAAYGILTGIYDDKIQVEITTGLKVYPNMIMESLQMIRNKDTTRSLPFTASFKQIRVVSSETVTIPAMTNKATSDRGTPIQKQGTKQTIVPTEAVEMRSGFRYLTDFLKVTNPSD